MENPLRIPVTGLSSDCGKLGQVQRLFALCLTTSTHGSGWGWPRCPALSSALTLTLLPLTKVSWTAFAGCKLRSRNSQHKNGSMMIHQTHAAMIHLEMKRWAINAFFSFLSFKGWIVMYGIYKLCWMINLYLVSSVWCNQHLYKGFNLLHRSYWLRTEKVTWRGEPTSITDTFLFQLNDSTWL